jgi:phosphoadenosine phosphosulfate reductase
MGLQPNFNVAKTLNSPISGEASGARDAFDRLSALQAGGADGRALLRHALLNLLPGRIATVSSFGAESAVLLSLIAEIDDTVPVLFLETGKHFPETLAYRDTLARKLGLLDVRSVSQDRVTLADRDPTGELWQFDTDACCALRKVEPLADALSGFAGWISGRKRHQASTRNALPFVELDGPHLKLNPLADWDGPRLQAEFARRGLPSHPLVSRGYPSIGCAVCTRPVGEGEDARAGRWSGSAKQECGIHRAPAAV